MQEMGRTDAGSFGEDSSWLEPLLGIRVEFS